MHFFFNEWNFFFSLSTQAKVFQFMMMMKEIFVFIRALSQADLIFLFGARLNWILHFGKPPRFKADVKIVQVLYRHS